MSGLHAYSIDSDFEYNLKTGIITEDSAFDNHPADKMLVVNESTSRNLCLADFGRAILGFAMDANDFFHFNNLKSLFPKIESASEFIDSKDYLGGVLVSVQGLAQDLDNLSAQQKLSITKSVLQQIKDKVKREAETTEFLGETGFIPCLISDRFTETEP